MEIYQKILLDLANWYTMKVKQGDFTSNDSIDCKSTAYKEILTDKKNIEEGNLIGIEKITSTWIQFLRECNSDYFINGKSLLSDSEFDMLTSQLRQAHADAKSKGVNIPYAPIDFKKITQSKPGAKTTPGKGHIKHQVPMLSLDKAYTAGDVEDFIKKIRKYLKEDDIKIDYLVEPKIDGNAFSALYRNGKYIASYSRGNGIYGEDITENIRQVIGLPSDIPFQGEIEIRGEVYIQKDDFQAINSCLEEQFTTARNLAAGTLKLLDHHEVSKRKLRYFAYNIIASDAEVSTQAEVLALLTRLGFTVNPEWQVLDNADDIKNFWDKLEAKHRSMNYALDGMVIKVNSLKFQERLGATEKHPRWALACKFHNPSAVTVVEGINFNVGRTGAITPVAELRPVEVNGVVISRATLHNFDNIAVKDIRIGDFVIIERAGDVIPQIIEVTSHKDGSDAFVPPKYCPSCSSELIYDAGETILRCPNLLSCPEQCFGRLVHMVSRDAFDIDSLGDKQLRQLWDLGLVKYPADIMQINPDSLRGLDRWGDKSINNLINNIEKSRDIALDRFIFALGVRHVGKDIAKMLALNCKTWENFLNIAQNKGEELVNIGKIGCKIASSIVAFFNEAQSLRIALDLAKTARISSYETSSAINTAFTGKRMVFTGKLQTISREEAKEVATKMGALVSNVVTGKTDYIVVGENAGSKLTKALDQDTKILNEDEWLAIVNGYKQ